MAWRKLLDVKSFWWRTWAIFLAVPVAWVAFGWILPSYVSDAHGERASFGDMFGAVNALFSGFAFCGLVVTLLLQGQAMQMQREELSLQRDEMRLMREEYSRSAKAQEDSERVLREQVTATMVAAKVQAMASIVDLAVAEGTHGVHMGVSLNLPPLKMIVEELTGFLKSQSTE